MSLLSTLSQPKTVLSVSVTQIVFEGCFDSRTEKKLLFLILLMLLLLHYSSVLFIFILSSLVSSLHLQSYQTTDRYNDGDSLVFCSFVRFFIPSHSQLLGIS